MKKKFGLAGLVVMMVMLALGAAAEEGNTIIIGCDMYAPYTYKNRTGEFVGVDVDFATEVAFFDRYSMFFSMLFNICWILYIFSSVT